MKVTIKMIYNLPSQYKEDVQVINVHGKRGTINMDGTATDKKITIVAKGKVGSKKVDGTFSKELGKKSKVKVVKFPKKQLKHFERKCKKLADEWEKKVKQ